jgi:hypothetical protein
VLAKEKFKGVKLVVFKAESVVDKEESVASTPIVIHLLLASTPGFASLVHHAEVGVAFHLLLIPTA